MRKADKKSSKKQSSVLEKLRKAKQIFAISMRRESVKVKARLIRDVWLSEQAYMVDA